MLTDIGMTLDRRSGDVTASEARNIIVTPEAAPEDPRQLALIDRYRKLAAPLMNRPAGKVIADLTPTNNAARESVIGDVVADSMRAAAARETGEPVDIALMNSGGLRAPLPYGQDGTITYADLFTVQPFNNTLVVMSLTGDQLLRILEGGLATPDPLALQVSAGSSYAWRMDAAGKPALVAGSIVVNGKPLDPAATYRVVTNNFLADGGEGIAAFREGTRRMQAGTDVDALEAWLKANSPLAPTPLDRIGRAP
jgi:5'-nucleotidase